MSPGDEGFQARIDSGGKRTGAPGRESSATPVGEGGERRARSEKLLFLGALAALLVGGDLVLGSALGAQETEIRREILESQRRLEEIREERTRLQREMESVRSRARNLTGELRNIERQLSTSRSVLAEIELQHDLATRRVEETTTELARTRERLQEARAVLSRRLRDIYKRGALHEVQVLLTADSFAELLTRYRYLQLIAIHDRALVDRVSELEQALRAQNRELQESLRELERLRRAKLSEVVQLRNVESDRQQTLESFRSREQATRSRLEALEADERRLTGLVDELERRRAALERRRAMTGRDEEEATLGTDAMGNLPWPVEGNLIYRFGRDQRPNGTVLRWNGIGIAATPGTPVRAVRAGRVVMAGPFEGYGPTVVLSHGGGFYTLYLYLEDLGVVEGREVDAGQVVGTVGGRDTPEGPHIEFQVRAPVQGESPRAMDPLRWLRPRFGSDAR